MTAPSMLVEIGELIRSRPGPHSPREQVADWYEHKAEVLHHIAEQTGDSETAQHSHRAHAHAEQLRAGTALPGVGAAAFGVVTTP